MSNPAKRSSRYWLIAPVILITLMIGYLAAGPFLTLYRIQEGLTEKNTTTLEENIDFQALRTSIKTQLNQQMAQTTDNALGGADNPMANLAKMFLSQAVDKIVEHSLTPKGLTNLMQGQAHPRKATETESGQQDKTPEPEPSPPTRNDSQPSDKVNLMDQADMTYDSLSQSSFWITNKKGQQTRIVFTRYGWRWKLSDIRLPAQAE